jgi:hypothetical protein
VKDPEQNEDGNQGGYEENYNDSLEVHKKACL